MDNDIEIRAAEIAAGYLNGDEEWHLSFSGDETKGWCSASGIGGQHALTPGFMAGWFAHQILFGRTEEDMCTLAPDAELNTAPPANTVALLFIAPVPESD